MSWTYIIGTIQVNSLGNGQPQCDYIVNTVLTHLPKVESDEGNLETYVHKLYGNNCSSNFNEFDEYVKDFEYQESYLITVHARLRYTPFEKGNRMFQKWLMRLAKRLPIEDMSIDIFDGMGKRLHLYESDLKYFNLYEQSISDTPSWVEEKLC